MVLAVAKCGGEAKQQGLPTRALMLGLLLLNLLRHLIDTGHLTRTIHKADLVQFTNEGWLFAWSITTNSTC